MRLLDALAKSDGLASDAGFDITVLQGGADAAAQTELHIPVRALLDGSKPELNVALHGGEQIRVAPAGKLYVVGNVKAPGAFPVTDADGLSVLKAVGLSQGLLPFSQENALLYRLVPETGKRIELSVPIKDILKHRAADVRLEATDILYVPDHPGKRLAVTVLERIAGVGTAAATVATWRSLELIPENATINPKDVDKMTNLPDNNDSPEKTQANSIATPRKGFDGASTQDRRHTNLFHEHKNRRRLHRRRRSQMASGRCAVPPLRRSPTTKRVRLFRTSLTSFTGNAGNLPPLSRSHWRPPRWSRCG